MESITLIEGAIHRPDEPRHFMEFQYPERRYVARFADTVVADSTRVLKLAEVGRHVYDPVIYFPLDDVNLDVLAATDKTTHCPLKGDTNYYDFVTPTERRDAIAWRYSKPFTFARTLEDYVAFDARCVHIGEM